MKQAWLAAQLDAFKGTPNYLKHQSLGAKEAETHLHKQMDSESVKTDIMIFFQDQLTLLYTLGAHLTLEVPSQIAEANQKKEMLTQSLAKLQKECRDMNAKEKDAVKESLKFKEQADIVSTENNSLKKQLQEVVDDRISLKMKVEEQRERLEALLAEIQGFKDRLTIADEQGKYTQRIEKQLTLLQTDLEASQQMLQKAHQEQ